jgi:hypothetical protein
MTAQNELLPCRCGHKPEIQVVVIQCTNGNCNMSAGGYFRPDQAIEALNNVMRNMPTHTHKFCRSCGAQLLPEQQRIYAPEGYTWQLVPDGSVVVNEDRIRSLFSEMNEYLHSIASSLDQEMLLAYSFHSQVSDFEKEFYAMIESARKEQS